MEYLPQFLTVASIHLLAVISPGPDFIMITRNTLVYSRKTGIYSAVGLGLGIGVHVAYSLLGIGLIISKSIFLFTVIKFIGAGYLFYIGYKSITSKKSQLHIKNEDKKEDISKVNAIKIGFITNVTNPKVTLFFLALFTQVIHPTTPFPVQLLYGVEMMVATGLWFTLVAIMFSHHVIKKGFEKVAHIAEKTIGAILIALGIKLALSTAK